MADTLQSLGFNLVGGHAQLDLDKSSLDNAVQNFGRQVQGADVALFYYAGHGAKGTVRNSSPRPSGRASKGSWPSGPTAFMRPEAGPLIG
jgi:uncharacterized caspase-like protein